MAKREIIKAQAVRVAGYVLYEFEYQGKHTVDLMALEIIERQFGIEFEVNHTPKEIRP